MGEVWRAGHNLLRREAAVKIIRPEMIDPGRSEGERTLLRFEREAQATAALRSPHSIDLYDFGVTDDGTFYYVMELLDGIDLETMVGKYGPQRSERVAFLLEQACHSLADAHAAGLIHRDVKPANIFACRMGLDHDFVKVLDFGLVKRRREDLSDDPLITDERTIQGTPAYMSPEMIRGGEIDGRSDLYSLGCVGWWLLTGRFLFEGKKAMEILVRHASDEPEPPSVYAELPVEPELEKIVLRCLAKEKEDRPASAEELGRSLAAIPFGNRWTRARAREWWVLNMLYP